MKANATYSSLMRADAVPADCAPAETFNYAFDALGRPVSRNDDAFGYNARSEVTSETYTGRSGSYSYDEIGNSTWYSANNLNQVA